MKQITAKFFILFIVITNTLTYATPLEKKLTDFYSDKRVLVTGGCGFIGSEVAQKLISSGAAVTIVDDLSTGSHANIEQINDSVTLIEKSITDFDTCIQATADCDIIFHLAAFISVPGSIDDPKKCYDVNVIGTLNLLEAARLNGVTSFILSSSSAIYGEQEGVYSEDMLAQPESPYGDSKLINELCCKQYAKHFGLHTVCLRYFNVFGPKQNPHSQYAAVIAKFTYNMERNLPITIFGDGLQTRDFVHVSDVALANIIMPLTNHAETAGQIFNIASGKSISLLELIEELKKEYPAYTGNIIFSDPRPGDVKHTSANISKFKKLITNLQST